MHRVLSCLAATLLFSTFVQAAELNNQHQAAINTWLNTAPAERGDLQSLKLPTNLSADDANALKAELWSIYGQSKAGRTSLQTFGELPKTMRDTIKNAQNGQIQLQSGAIKVGEIVMPFVVIRRESNDEPENGRNLFICTHGGGANGDVDGPHAWPVNTREWQVQAQLAMQAYPSDGIYFVPRMADDRMGRWWHKHNQQAFEMVIRHAIMHWGVNPNRVYKLGISEGGFGTAILAPFMADRWAGADSMAAGVGLGNPPENLRNVAFRTDVGEKDTMFNRVGLAKAFHERLNELHKKDPDGYVHSIGVQAGRGHGIDYRPGVTWMTKHTRNPAPDKVVWVSKPLHGQRRKQFYWIGLTGEKLEGVIRIVGAIDRKTNTVTITANQLAIEGAGGYETHAKEGEIKSADPLKNATIRVMLNDAMVNLEKPVKIIINGQAVHDGKIARSTTTMLATLAERGDPSYCFSAQITHELK